MSNKFMEGIETEKPIICCHIPLYHAFGSVGGSLVSAVRKGTVVFPSEVYNPNESLKAIEDFKYTTVS